MTANDVIEHARTYGVTLVAKDGHIYALGPIGPELRTLVNESSTELLNTLPHLWDGWPLIVHLEQYRRAKRLYGEQKARVLFPHSAVRFAQYSHQVDQAG